MPQYLNLNPIADPGRRGRTTMLATRPGRCPATLAPGYLCPADYRYLGMKPSEDLHGLRNGAEMSLATLRPSWTCEHSSRVTKKWTDTAKPRQAEVADTPARDH